MISVIYCVEFFPARAYFKLIFNRTCLRILKYWL